MVFNLYIYNKIGSEAVGIFNLIMSVYMLAVTLATSGLNIACTYIVSEQFSKGDYSNGIRAVKNCFSFSTLLGLFSSFILILFSNIISQNWLQATVSNIPLYLIAIGLPFIGISSVLNGYFAAVRKAYKSAFSQAFELTVKIFATILLLTFYPSHNIESICISLILGDVISEICSCILLVVLYHKDKNKYIKRTSKNFNFKKQILKIVFPVSITSCVRSGLSTLMQFVIPNRLMLFGISYSVALSEYGKISGMAMSILLFPSVFIMSFSNLLVPEFASLSAMQYKKRILQICQKVFSYTSAFSIIIAIIFFFFSNEISMLAFQNSECTNYIIVLAPLVLFMYVNNIIDSILKGLNKQFSVMICNILDLILTIGILYFLLPILGILGYLLAIMISELFNFIISYFQLYKATKFKMEPYIAGLYLFCAFLGFYELFRLL